MKKLLCTLAILIVCLVSCRNEKKQDQPVITDQTQELTIGIMPTLDALPFLVAQKKGIYDSLRLNLTIKNYNSSSDRDAAFVNNHIEGMTTDFISATILNTTHNKQLKIILKNDGYFCFVVSKNSNIRNLEQLKSKNIAISSNTIIDYATDRLLNKVNISKEVVNKPEISEVPLRMQMIEYGQVDASFIPEPMATIAMQKGHKTLISTRELKLNLLVTAFSKKAISDKSEGIKRLISGYNLAIDYITKHPQKDIKQILIEMGIPENLTGLIMLPNYRKATLPSNRETKSAIEWLKEQRKIPQSYSEINLIDTTFTHRAQTKSQENSFSFWHYFCSI